MEYLELIEKLGNFGILIVIAGIFLWDHIHYKKKLQKTMEKDFSILNEIQNTNANMTKSLELLEENMAVQKTFLENLNTNYIKIEDKIKNIKLSSEGDK